MFLLKGLLPPQCMCFLKHTSGSKGVPWYLLEDKVSVWLSGKMGQVAETVAKLLPIPAI